MINNYRQNINKLIYVENLNSDLVKDILIERNIDILILAGVGIVKDNIIQFQYVNPNYSTRLNPETLLAILETM